MKTLLFALAAAMLFTVAVPTHGAGVAAPAETVRVIHDSETDQICSAVVIAPGYALTARHCLRSDSSIDGIVISYASLPMSPYTDIAVVFAPGLRCPCAELGGRPAIGTSVVAIGFPGKLKGAKRVTEVAKVSFTGPAIVLAPWSAHPYATRSTYIFTDKPIIDHGDSGGGLFAVQGERWVLIGINAVGVPASPAPSPSQPEQASGFTPVDFAAPFLPKVPQ